MVHVTFELDEALKKELRFIDRNLVNRATMKALRSIAKPVRDDARSAAPVRTHALQMNLGMTSSFNQRRGIGVVYVGLSKKNHPVWLITRGLAMEYGNIHVRAQPYLSQAADQNRTPVYQDFRRFLNSHLDKLVAKA